MKALEQAADDACATELGARGLSQIEPGIFELALTPGMTGMVNIALESSYSRHGELWIYIRPLAGVRHDETSALVSDFLATPAESPLRKSRGCVTLPLIHLLPGQQNRRREWMLGVITDAAEVARQVADDVAQYGFPYIDRLSASAEGLLKEMNRPLHRMIRRLDRAVLSVLCGRVSDAKPILMENLPVSHFPTTWGDPVYAGFLRAFSNYFQIDLEIESWPLREQSTKKNIRINVQDRGVIMLALEYVNRSDLAGRIAILTDKQMEGIAVRAAEIMNSMTAKDFQRAVGLAATELMSAS